MRTRIRWSSLPLSLRVMIVGLFITSVANVFAAAGMFLYATALGTAALLVWGLAFIVWFLWD